MRADRGRPRDVEVFDDPEPRSARRKADPAPNTSSVRSEWESTVCPECGTELPDSTNVRVRRTGDDYEARCLVCGAVAARYVDGIWTS